MKKILSVVLALVLVCGLAVSAMAAGVNMGTDKTIIGPGETVTVTITLDEAVEDLLGVELFVYYDKDALTYVSTSSSYSWLGDYLVNNRIQINSGTDFSYKDLAAGTIAVVTFTANETTVKEELSVSVEVNLINDLGEYVLSENASATVTVCPNHNVVETVVDSTCQDPGSVTNSCANCGYSKTTELPPIDHTVEHVDAVAATCNSDGNIEYWYCTVCGAAWTDEPCTKVTDLQSVKVGAQCTNIVPVEAVEPDCHFEGNIDYWYCPECGKVWQDEALTQLTNHENVILPAVGGEVVHVEAKDATCFEEGNIEYWYCEECEQVWQNEALTELTNHMNVKLAVPHNIEHVEANECTCWENGNIEYWYCTDCGYAWLDEYQHLNTNLMSVVLPYTGHTVEHVDAKAPTCTEKGNVEYWYCTCCGYAWTNEECTQVTNLQSVVLPATGHVDEDEDLICDVCECDLSSAQTGDFTVVTVAAVALVSMMAVVALPVMKKKFF